MKAAAKKSWNGGHPKNSRLSCFTGRSAGLRAVENSIDKVGNTPMTCVKIRSVSNKSTGICKHTAFAHVRQSVLNREIQDLLLVKSNQGTCYNDKRCSFVGCGQLGILFPNQGWDHEPQAIVSPMAISVQRIYILSIRPVTQ